MGAGRNKIQSFPVCGRARAAILLAGWSSTGAGAPGRTGSSATEGEVT